MTARWRNLIIRVAIATFVAWIIATVPIPQIPAHIWFAYFQVPAAIFLFICYVGKLLIDTFFYNHYRP